jgi:hypothetical protein
MDASAHEATGHDALTETGYRLAEKNGGPKRDRAARPTSRSISCVNAISFP